MLAKAVRVSVAYLVFGILWILVSDWFVHSLLPETTLAQTTQTVKGILFVLASAIVIFAATWRELVKERGYLLKISSAEFQLRQVAERTSDLIYTYQIQPETKYRYVSPSIHKVTGYSPEKFYRDANLALKIVHPEDKALLEKLLEPENEGKPFKIRWIHKSGKIIIIELSNVGVRDEQGNIIGISGVGRDVTEAERSRLELEHLNHAYSVLWQMNRLIIKQNSVAEIYRDACAIPLSRGNFLLVWVGIVNKISNRVEPAAKAGEKAGYLDNILITLDDTPTGRGPTGLAARTGKAYWSTDIETDEFMAPWREKALENGFRSSAAFPLKIDGEVIATWTLYSPVPGYFTDAVPQLYQQLAGDISFALQTIAIRTEKEKLAKALEVSTLRWQFAIEASGEGLWDWNLKTDEVFFSDKIALMLGYTPQEWGTTLDAWEKRVHPDDIAGAKAAIAAHLRGELPVYENEHRLLGKDGSYRWIFDRGSIIERDESGQPSRMIGLHRDITAAREQELATQERNESLQAVITESPLGIAIVSTVTGRIIATNPAFCSILARTDAELRENTWQIVTHPEDIEANEAMNLEIMNGQRTGYVLEKRYIRPDKSLIWARLTVRSLQHYRAHENVHVALIEDITERIEREKRLRLDAAVISHTRDGVVITDLQPKIVSVNRAYTEITGYTEAEVIGKNPSILQSGRQDQAFYDAMWRKIKSSGFWQGELYNRRKNGEVYPQISTIDTIFNAQGQPEYYVGVFSDISKLKESEESFERLAHFDVLTGLPNRLMVTNRLTHSLISAARHRRITAVLFMDLDHFKNINDSLGHIVGDELLAAVATRLKARIRAEDTIARLGGDEFLVLLEELESPEQAALVARDLLENLSAPFQLASGHEIYTGGSIGISLYPQDGENPHDLIRNADAAMYLSKSEGRNTFRFYMHALTAAARKRLDLEAALRRGLERGELYVKYQPIVNLQSGAIVGAEALCRWRTAEGQEIMPADFIPVAEDTGLIVQIGAFVARSALKEAFTWTKQDAQFKTMAINFSVRQFQKADWYDLFTRIIRESGVDPHMIEAEITESAIMQKSEEAVEVIRRLHEMGVRIAIDDFGTGYSSLSYLQRFSVNKMKIDQSFVRDLPDNAAAARLVRTMIRLGKSLGLEIQAEGVETEAQRQFLLAEQCDTYQGYLTSPPVTAEEFKAKFLKANLSSK